MSLTSAQRSEINKANSSHAKGPVSAAGKRISRANAMKHGLRAKLLALPTEDPAALQAREDSWNDYYQPQSPGAQHLVNRCAHATVLSDRVDRHENAMLSRQIHDAEAQWDRDQQTALDAARALLATNPLAATPVLMRTAAGCRHLLTRWDAFAAILEGGGSWTEAQADEVVQMTGRNPFRLAESDEAWEMILHAHAAARPGDDGVGARGWVFDPDSCRPDAYPRVPDPDPASARAWLLDLVAAHRGAVVACEAELRGAEAAARVEAGDCAAILQDGPSARLFLRYQAEARTSFHRAFSELVKTLARDKAEAEAEAAEPASPNEPIFVASAKLGATFVASRMFTRSSDGGLLWVGDETVWTPPEEAALIEAKRASNPPPGA